VSTTVLPCVCAWCERVRTLGGGWEEPALEPTVEDATHGICPECLKAQTREAAVGVDLR
jgi:hypothetical protein